MKLAAGIFAVCLVIGIAMNGQAVIPSAKPLGKLVKAEDAVRLKQFYLDLATIVKDDSQLTTMSQFRNCQSLAVDCLQANGDFGTLKQLNQPINAILLDAFGGSAPDADLTPELRSKLAAALDKVSSKF